MILRVLFLINRFLLRNDLEYRYEKTAKELELKRNEVVNLTKEYEQRIRIKEVNNAF